MNVCTIIARNYVAHARVLAESFRLAHPDGTCTVLVIDDPSDYIDAAEEPFELLTLGEIGLDHPERMAASYDVMELSTAVKPWLLRTLLARPDVGSITYLDPDIRVFAPLEEIERRALEHNVVLTPHFTAPLPRDNRKPSEEDILIAGAYNLGFISLGAGETADALLDWWAERLETHCLNAPEEGRFVDQRWIDLAPGIWPGIDVLRDPSFNIAYWNLPTRRLEIDGDGYRVDGEPLHFFHFSGFDPRRPTDLSKHQNRIEVGGDDPALMRICGEYAEELMAAGFERATGWPYGWDEMAGGAPLDRPARRAYREAVEADRFGDSVFEEAGARQFVGYLTGPANGGISRYAQAVWDSRPDFRQIFPSIEGEKGPAFVSWLRETAADTGIPTQLLPPAPPSSNGQPRTPNREPPATEPGVNVVGYVSSERGVGEVARQIYAALQSGGIGSTTIDSPADPAEIPKALGSLDDEDHPYDVNLICVNADMLPAVAAGLGPRFFEGRYSAGLWFWEVTQFPEFWRGSFDHVDAVWVGSEHIAQALQPLAPIPVRTIRLPVIPGPVAEMSRAELGMPDGFCFLFVFDYRSVFRRKNPLGVVEAFRQAFEPGSGPSLVIKSICSDEFPAQREELAEAVRDRPDIHLIEDMVAPEAKNAMIASCDCYVSLHRSEGLGLTMAEAMYFGRPVIATGYSGNLDFMTEKNSFLVPYEMVEIGDEAPPYPPEGEWAEPDLDYAARVMSDVFHHPKVAAERGEGAAADIRRTNSLEATREAVETLVAEAERQRLAARLRHPAVEPSGPEIDETGRGRLEHLLEIGVAPHSTEGSRRLTASAKRLYRRLLRPYAAYQQRVNGSITQSLDELRQMFTEDLELEGAVDSKLAATNEKLRLLADDVARDRQRTARSDELVAAARAQPFMSDDRLAPRKHPLLGGTIGFRSAPATGDDGDYRGFEDLFRGSEEMIRDRQRGYLELVAGRGPVLDAGCGRGEFLDLLREREIEYQGVDLDAGMVRRCQEKGHEKVEEGDLLDFLERTPVGSLGAIFSAQVIEHLEFEKLRRLLELSRSRLRPGGLLIAETVNPHSPAALKAFWVDPTHQHPLFPEVMLELCALADFAAGDVFAPIGTGDWEKDRTSAGEYAVVAVAPE